MAAGDALPPARSSQAECETLSDRPEVLSRLAVDFAAFDVVCLEWGTDGKGTVASVTSLYARMQHPLPLIVLLLSTARDEEAEAQAMELVSAGVLVFRKPVSLELAQKIVLNHSWRRFKHAAGSGESLNAGGAEIFARASTSGVATFSVAVPDSS